MAADIRKVKETDLAEETNVIKPEIQSLVNRIHEYGDQCAVLYFKECSKKMECYGTGASKDFFSEDIIAKFLSLCYNAESTSKKNLKRNIPCKPMLKNSGTKKPRLSAPGKVRERGLDVSTDQKIDVITTTQFSNNFQDTECLSGNSLVCEEIIKTEVIDPTYDDAVEKEGRILGRRKSAVKFKEMMAVLGSRKQKKQEKSQIKQRLPSKENPDNLGKTNRTIQTSQKNNMETENQINEDTNDDEYVDDDLDEDWEANTELNKTEKAKNHKSNNTKKGKKRLKVSVKSSKSSSRKSSKLKNSLKKTLSVEKSVGFPKELDDDNNIEPKCLECGKEFKNLSGLDIHLRRSKHELVCNTETDYKCFTCYRYYLRFSDLKRHMENTDHSGNTDKKGSQERTVCKIQSKKLDGKVRAQFRCSLCRAEYRHEKNCQEHIDKATCVRIPLPKKCPCCSSVFKSRNFLEVHLKQKHKSEFPFRCNLCSKIFFEIRQFTNHQQKHKQEKNTSEVSENTEGKEGIDDIESVEIDQSDAQEALDGPAAPVGSAEKEILDNQRLEEIISKQRRLRGVTDDQAVIQDEVDCEQECVVCHEKFVNYTQMKVHINETVHEQIVTKETGYKCYTCYKYFVKYLDLKHHMEITKHTGNPEFEATRKPIKLNAQRVKKTKREYKCSCCFSEFFTLEKCEEHIRLNMCKKKFKKKCPCCDLLLWRRNDYYAHLYQYHRYDYPFMCDKCDTEFTLLRAFTAHCKTHENSINYDCDQCGKVYLKPYQLNQHKQEAHNKSPNKEKEISDTNTSSAASQVNKEVLDNEQTNNETVMTEEAADTKGTSSASGKGQDVIDINGTSTESDYKCFNCNLYYLNMKSLRDHISLTGHTGNPDFTGVVKLVPIVLKKASKNSVPFRCNKCHCSFPTLKTAQKHVSDATCTAYWRKICPCCGSIFRKRNFYEAHMLESHKNEYPFRCEDCERVFYKASAYSSHRVSSHDREPFSPYPEGFIKVFQCPHCPKKFKGKGNYNQHIRSVHVKEKRFICDVCGKRFLRQHYLRDHVRNVHNSEVTRADCTCEICGKVLKTPKTKEIHVKFMHLKGKDHICHICGHQARKIYGLRAHFAQRHSDVEAFKCGLCNASYKIKSYYDMHMATHYLKLGDVESAKLYSIVHQCDICNKYFAGKTKCQIHILRHFGEYGLVQCKLCDLRIAASRGGILNHYRRGHKLNRQQMEPYMADVPSTKQLLANARKLAKDIPISDLISQEEKSKPKQKKVYDFEDGLQKIKITVNPENEEEEEEEEEEYEDQEEEDDEEYLPTKSIKPRSSIKQEQTVAKQKTDSKQHTVTKPAARDYLKEAESQVAILEKIEEVPVVGNNEVVDSVQESSSDILLSVLQGLSEEEKQTILQHQGSSDIYLMTNEHGVVTIKLSKS